MSAVHLEGVASLAEFLKPLTKLGAKERVLCFFDFDRTLTNGTSFEVESPLNKRIRGGKHTLQALEKLQASGAHLYIMTARQPRVLVVEQLQQSLRKAQSELQKMFPHSNNVSEFEFNGVPLASDGKALYACGYQKAVGIAHALVAHNKDYKDDIRRQRVYFFDDAVVNAAAVIKSLKTILTDAKRTDLLDKFDLEVCWWDPFSEETGKAPTMDPIHSESTDFNFHDYLAADLKLFGVTEKERERRRNVYIKEEKEQGRKPPSALVEKTNPKKLKDVNATHGGLGDFLLKRKK